MIVRSLLGCAKTKSTYLVLGGGGGVCLQSRQLKRWFPRGCWSFDCSMSPVEPNTTRIDTEFAVRDTVVKSLRIDGWMIQPFDFVYEHSLSVR